MNIHGDIREFITESNVHRLLEVRRDILTFSANLICFTNNKNLIGISLKNTRLYVNLIIIWPFSIPIFPRKFFPSLILTNCPRSREITPVIKRHRTPIIRFISCFFHYGHLDNLALLVELGFHIPFGTKWFILWAILLSMRTAFCIPARSRIFDCPSP